MVARMPDAHFLTYSQENGGKVIYFDPNYSASAEKANEWVRIAPDPDGAFALAMVKTIIDKDLYDKHYDGSANLRESAGSASKSADQAPAAAPENADGLSNEDALLADFLIDKVLNDDTTNADGAFALPKGTEITREIVLEAKEHDALLLLTMSVD